ncbi:hypothetical protein Hamer_G013868 [Homarus americanus]|uniref:Uncharacterized protein n=1 Tax=Homarus americanus TaxID=6706 RepID=A0A8J5K5K1_HOMAM|nr:hypothetical protein Hamer_G013868 [Homarus americanus]
MESEAGRVKNNKLWSFSHNLFKFTVGYSPTNKICGSTELQDVREKIQYIRPSTSYPPLWSHLLHTLPHTYW